ncbi:exodeoxyribonuclease V subunit alpha [Limnohabitans sp.]|uniref:exodeoxyribonuclease V subunit alpha n=1 Tax=Limnohabitans sp. TaxID=1907725 RepID=UPI0037C04D99
MSPAAQRDWLQDGPQPAPGLSTAQALQWLMAASEAGWLRRLDSALAAQLQRLDPATPAPVLVAAALLAHMEGRGHTCLALHDLASPPVALLGWPAQALQSPQGLLALWAQMPTDAAAWRWSLQAAPSAVLRRFDAPEGGQPLVLGGSVDAPLLYLRRYSAYEARVGQNLLQRAQNAVPVPEALARAWLDRFFDAPAHPVIHEEEMGEKRGASLEDPKFPKFPKFPISPMAAVSATDWQKLACAVALRAHLSVITGGPGTGKTYTAARLLALLLALHTGPSPLRVALAAPTGKAAARLKQSIDGALKALQGLAQQGPAGQGAQEGAQEGVQEGVQEGAQEGVQEGAQEGVQDGAQEGAQEGVQEGVQVAAGEGLDLDTLIQRIGPARTLHALLGARPDTRMFRHHAANPLDVDVLIVDEASMVHLEMMDALLQALPPTARLVLLGDKDQLASVEAGAVLGDVCRDAFQGGYQAETLRFAQEVAGQSLAETFHARAGQAVSALAQQTVMLRQSRRFDGPIGQLAEAVNAGHVDAAWACLAAPSGPAQPLLALQPDSPQAVWALALGRSHKPSYTDYLLRLRQGPAGADADAHADWVRSVLQAFDRCRILCAVHQGEWGSHALNAGVQKALAEAHWLAPQGEWFAGRPVMVTRNDAQLGVFNGDVGVAMPNLQGQLKVWFLDGEQLRSVSVSRLAHVQTAFAMTVHKSQGSEFAHTVLVLPPGAAEVLSREWVYTGITRAREQFSLVEAQAGLFNAALARPSVRASGLRLWWGG